MFYRSTPEQRLTTMGIVERCRRMSDIGGIASAIGKRSVYALADVEEMVKESGTILIINFRLIAHLPREIPLEELVNSNVFNKRPPQSIMNLGEDSYLALKGLYGQK